MPRLKDLVANQGLTFKNSFVDFSLCSPSRASFFTGMSSHNTGLVGNGDESWGGYELFQPLEAEALAVRLQAAGYRTGFFGKYMNDYVDDVPPGWDRWVAYSGRATQYNYRLSVDGNKTKKGDKPEDYGDDVVAREAVDWIRDTSGSGAFFAMIATKSPHEPNLPPPRHDGAFSGLALPKPPNFNEADVSDKPVFAQLPSLGETDIAAIETAFRKRQEQLKGVEDIVEQVIDALRDTGQLDNTIIIYSSDNGFSHGEHRRPTNKALLYDEIIRVPLIIRGPGIPGGESRDQLVNNLDLTASILSWAGATSQYALDGRPLAPVIADADAPGGRISSSMATAATNSARRSLPISTASAPSGLAFVLRPAQARGRRFGRGTVRYRSRPLATRQPQRRPGLQGVADALRASLEKLATCKGDDCWDDSPDPAAPAETPTNVQ